MLTPARPRRAPVAGTPPKARPGVAWSPQSLSSRRSPVGKKTPSVVHAFSKAVCLAVFSPVLVPVGRRRGSRAGSAARGRCTNRRASPSHRKSARNDQREGSVAVARHPIEYVIRYASRNCPREQGSLSVAHRMATAHSRARQSAMIPRVVRKSPCPASNVPRLGCRDAACAREIQRSLPTVMPLIRRYAYHCCGACPGGQLRPMRLLSIKDRGEGDLSLLAAARNWPPGDFWRVATERREK